MTPEARHAIRSVLKHEGGYVDHERDPGGATNMGITLRTLEDWRGRPTSKLDVMNLTEAEASAIYLHRYWMPIRGDDLPEPLAFVTMDAAVNSGANRAARWLQQSVGVIADGAIGPHTVGAAQRAKPRDALDTFMDLRMSFLRSLKTWGTFGRGWERRVRAVHAEAERLI